MADKKPDTVYVLTFEVNDYDQHGEYFLAAFKGKPTIEILSGVPTLNYDVPSLEHLLKGGGRRGHEHVWYNLVEVELI